MPYVALKCRIYDLTHARKYLLELERWDSSTKKKFSHIRRLLEITDQKKTLADFFELREIRLFNKEVSKDMSLLKQYCRKKDWDEREKEKAWREKEKLRAKRKEEVLQEKKEKQNLTQFPTKQVLAVLVDRIDELPEKIAKEVLKCLKSKKS